MLRLMLMLRRIKSGSFRIGTKELSAVIAVTLKLRTAYMALIVARILTNIEMSAFWSSNAVLNFIILL